MAHELQVGEVGFGTPFQAQIEFFRRKLNLPTDRWDDVKGRANDRAFIVAGAKRADLLQDLRNAVDRAMAGGGQAQFRRDFRATVAKHGWTGWTGEGSAAGEAWRTRVIYQTNMATAYSAGRRAQLTDPEFLRLMPYWRYRHADGVLHPRPLHLAWNGLTLRHDHSFWKAHFPPNGWGCHCKVFAAKAPAPGAPTEPPEGWDNLDEATGAPPGIDTGFDYAPGAAATTPLADLVAQKAIDLGAPIGAEMWRALAPAIALERQQAWWNALDSWLADPLPRGRSAVVGAMAPADLQWLEQRQVADVQSAALVLDDRLVLGAKQRRHEKAQNALVEAEWRAIPTLLDNPAAVYWDAPNGAIVYLTAGKGPTKVAVEFKASGGADRVSRVLTAFRVSEADVASLIKRGDWTAMREPGA